MIVPRPSYLRLRRLVTLAAVVVALGVAAHGVFQVIEHHDGAQDAIALCTAAVALIATLGLVGAGRSARRSVPVLWTALTAPIPGEAVAVATRRSPVWLQRFQN